MISTAKGQIGGRREGAGPPRGNRNAQRHGLRSAQLPDGCRYIEHACNRLRRELEAAVGETTIVEAALIQSCIRHERRASLAEKWLREQGVALPLGERLQLLHTISNATDSRDKCIRALNLDGSTADPWETLNRRRIAAADDATVPQTGADDDASDDRAESYDDTSHSRHPVSDESEPLPPPTGQAVHPEPAPEILEEGTR